MSGDRLPADFDLQSQAFPGDANPERSAREDAGLQKPSGANAPRLGRPTCSEEYRRLRLCLDSLSDQEILEGYRTLRDEKVPRAEGWYYPNVRILHGTAFEREKDRREQQIWNETHGESEVVRWYREAREKPCAWWIENHLIARHALTSCMSCGVCSSLCPAAEFYDYNPRAIMEIVQEKDEQTLVELLRSDTIWYCYQCASCKAKCPRQNSPFGMLSSLRQLSQLKGYHVHSIRGRQQVAARHLWGGNLWNRACSLYFRNPNPEAHRDFGPRHEKLYKSPEIAFRQVGASPDMPGSLSARKVHPETLQEVRRLWHAGGALFLWQMIDEAAARGAVEDGLTIDEYHDKAKTEG